MPTVTNTLVDASGAPMVHVGVTISLVSVTNWSTDGARETLARYRGVTDTSGLWSVVLPAQSSYEGGATSTYYSVAEPGVTRTFTVADSPSTQRLRDRLITPSPPLPITGIALDDLSDVSTSGEAAGKVLGFDGSLWAPVTVSGGGSGSVNSVSGGDATITIGGTANDPTVGVNAIPESKVTNLVTDLATKAASVHTHVESDTTNLTTDLTAKTPTSRLITAGTGLAGGGSLAADRTLSVAYGTSAGTAVQGNDPSVTNARTPTAHNHPESDVVGLVTDLANKAATGHTHTEGDVTNLTTDLAAKADLVSGKVPTAELGAGAANSAKFLRGDQSWAAPAGGGTVTSVTAGDSTITVAGTANDPTVAVNSITESKVTGLVTDLAAKAASVHTHTESDVTNLATDLASKAAKLTATATKTANYTAAAGELVRADSSGGTFTVTLPASTVGALVAIKKTDATATAVSFLPTGADTIDGAASGSLILPNQSRVFLGVTGGWTVPYGLNSLSSLDARFATAVHAHAESDITSLLADLANRQFKLTPTATKTANYTAASADAVICDASGGGFTVTFPAAAAGGAPIAVRKGDSSANVVTVAANGTDTFGIINPTSTVPVQLPGQVIVFIPTSGSWLPISGINPVSSLDARYPRLPDVQSYTSASTWTKPLVTTSYAIIVAIGGGSGAGAGRRGAAGTVRCGGGGGAGGGMNVAIIPTSALNATEAVAVAAGGTGGAAQTVNDTNGAGGNGGGASTFGVRGSNFLVSTRVNIGGAGGTATTGSAGSATNTAAFPGGAGGAASTTGLVGATGFNSAGGAGGGGSGGGITSADVPSAGGPAGTASSASSANSVPAGGAIDTSGGAGTAVQAGGARPGGGGSGGGSSITTVGGTGGAGGQYGGGGAGGGASVNPNNSGAGGAGADGHVTVTTI